MIETNVSSWEALVSERREQPRIKFVTAVDLSSGSNFYTGFSLNLSEGGIFVATYLLWPPGTTIDLEVSLPDGGPAICARGEVRWISDTEVTERPGMGLRFKDLSEHDRERIERFIEGREPLFYED